MPDSNDVDHPNGHPDFVPDDRFVASVRRRVTARRRRNRRVLASSTLVVALLGGGGAWYANHRLSAIQRIDLDPAVSAPDASDPLTTGAPFNLLVLGFDGCPLGAAPEECDGDRPQPAHADSIVVVHVDPAAKTLDVLHLYRDLALDGERKLSELSTTELIKTIETHLDITIDHYIGLGFGGFRDLGELLELRVDIGATVRDRMTGLDLSPGCQVLTGPQLLALVRARHLEVRQDDGSWMLDATGDLGRVDRRQKLLVAAMTQLPDLGLGDATKLDALARQLERSAVVDDGLDNADLLDLGHLLTTLELTTTTDLPVVDETMSTGVFILEAGAPDEVASAVAPFDSDDAPVPPVTPETIPPASGEFGPIWSDIESC